MANAPAIKLAIDLLHLPAQVRFLRSAPLPDDVLTLIRIVAGDEDTLGSTADLVGRSREKVREAAAFFVEQILLEPNADSYRVLGSRPDAPHQDLRRNMALLLRWLHPDTDQLSQRVVFASRVTRAWNDLKTQDRRAAYDRRMARAAKSQSRPWRPAHNKPSLNAGNRPWGYGRPSGVASRQSVPSSVARGRGLLHRMLLLLLGRGAM